MKPNGFLDYKIFPITDLEQSDYTLGEIATQRIFIVYLDEARPELVVFLNKITAALQLDIKKDCVVLSVPEVADLPSFSLLSQRNMFEKIIVFGLLPAQFGLHIQSVLYQPFELQQHTFLFADKLSKIESDKNLKSALWTRLQALFNLAK
jgi:DNA polymerase III psi subunit